MFGQNVFEALKEQLLEQATKIRIGNLATLKYPNGVTNLWQFDSLNRLTNLTWKYNGAARADFAYKLGLTGTRTNLSETVNAISRVFAWQFDKLYRLTNETVSGTAPTGTLGYGYDLVGNRTNRNGTLGSLGSQTLNYSTNDWVDNDANPGNGSTYFDANGNTASLDGTWQYDWANRLTNFNSGAAIYVYDAAGNRIKKIAGGVTTWYLVATLNPSGWPQVVEEHTGSSPGTLSRRYTYGLDLISQSRWTGSVWETHFYLTDGLGSTRALLNSSGSISDTYLYDAYGTLIASTGSTPNDYLFTGEQRDATIGQYYLRARTMHPGYGRLWTRDTFEGNQSDPLSLHKYLYAGDDPVNNIDPSGNEFIGSVMATLSISSMLAAQIFPMSAAAITGGRVAKSRPLTQGEITMTQLIFGGKINYTKPKIFNRPYVSQSLFTAVTPNGNIYVRGDGTPAGGLYRADYSLDADIEIRAVFIHEMTHVWQHQVGMAVTLRAILDRNYYHDFATFGTKDFKKYGIEEQAQIVEDFYLLLNGGQIKRNRAVVSSHPPLQTYQVITGVYFP